MKNCLKTYDDIIEDLTSQGKFYINLGLDRISAVLDLVGNPQDKLKCIQVAGTNGKGSVCTMLSAILTESGYKTGLYTSPHIFDYTERIKINGVDISKQDFTNYCDEIITIADKNDIHLTEFEILTAVMYKYFADKKVDVAVIETGLGGRFDATNVIKSNLCSIITHIDLDHTDRLGDTKEKIAFEKAGIIKPDSILITSEGYEVIKDTATSLNSAFILTSPCTDSDFTETLTLKGEHQKENLALVLGAISTLFPDIDKSTVINGLKKVKNPCRFQYIKDKNLIIDGAHNPNCFEELRRNLDNYFPDTKRNYIFGCLNTKDHKSMLSYITTDPNLNKLFCYHFNNKNACSIEDLSKDTEQPIIELKNIEDVLSSTSEVLTVICGSFYMLNELIKKEWVL